MYAEFLTLHKRMFIRGINKGSSSISFAMRFTTITQGNARGITVFDMSLTMHQHHKVVSRIDGSVTALQNKM